MLADKRRLFEGWADKVEEYVEEHPIQMLYWEVTRNCDLNCVHCGSPSHTWESQSELTDEEVLGFFKYFASRYNAEDFKFLSLTGGEPFVRQRFLYLLEAIADFGIIPITIQTNSNYLSMNLDLVNKLIHIGVLGMGVDLDGIERTHDAFRKREGNFKNTLEVLRVISSVPEYIHSTITTVVTRKNIKELPYLRDIIRKVNPNRWRLAPFDPIGRGKDSVEYSMKPEDYKVMLNFAKRERLEYIHDKEKTQIELACGGWLGIELEGKVRPYIWHCVAGINLLGIMYDGGIGSCSNIPRYYNQGNIRNDDVFEVWENRFYEFRNFEWKKNGDCVGCDQWEFCHGGPMHKRLSDGKMLNCIYKTYYNDIDYGVGECLQHATETITGN